MHRSDESLLEKVSMVSMVLPGMENDHKLIEIVILKKVFYVKIKKSFLFSKISLFFPLFFERDFRG